MTDKQIPSLNEFLREKMQMQTDITGIRGGLGQPLSAINAPNLNIQFPKMGEITKNILQIQGKRESLFEWANIMAQPLLDKGVIQNAESLTVTISQSVSFSVAIPNNLSFATRLKMTDTFITMQKSLESIPNYSEMLRKAVSIPFSDLYADIFDIFNKNLTPKKYDDFDDDDFEYDEINNPLGLSREHWDGDGFLVFGDSDDDGVNFDFGIEPGDFDSNEGEKIHIFDDYVEINEDEAKIVNTELYEAGKTIINYYNITNVYVNQNYNATTPEELETKSAWNRFLAPALGVIGTVLLTWAMAGDPIEDMNISHTYNDIKEHIKEHIKQHPIQQSDLQIQLKEPQQNNIEDIDKNNIDTTSV